MAERWRVQNFAVWMPLLTENAGVEIRLKLGYSVLAGVMWADSHLLIILCIKKYKN